MRNSHTVHGGVQFLHKIQVEGISRKKGIQVTANDATVKFNSPSNFLTTPRTKHKFYKFVY